LKSFPDDPSTLGKPELFFLQIIDIPRLAVKVESFVFKLNFQAQIDELEPEIKALKKACDQLKNSKKFAKVLQVVLALGNYINGGTFRGGFAGFKLDSLLMMQDMRSPADPKFNLLTYFAKLLREKYPDVLNFYDDMTAIEAAKKVALQNLIGEVNTLRKSLRVVITEVEEAKVDNTSSFVEVLGGFVESASAVFDKLDQELNEAQKAFNETAVFYGEDVKTTTPEEFFTIIHNFHTGLDRAHRDAQQQKEEAEKQAKRAAAQAANKQARTTAANQKTELSAPADTTNLMDNLISDLKSDTIKDTIKAHRSRIGPPPAGAGAAVASEALTVVLRKTGGIKK